jgi:hypothetical protein
MACRWTHTSLWIAGSESGSTFTRGSVHRQKLKFQVLPRFELGSQDSES